MANRETIKKVNNELRYGDKRVLASRTGLSVLTVNRFFNGKENELIEDTHTKIMTAALEIIEERQKREKALEKKTNSILG